MARGWESKSVEEQQSEFGRPSSGQKAAGNSASSKLASAAQALRLKRARVVQQLKESQNTRFIELMQKELAFLDAELAKLEDQH